MKFKGEKDYSKNVNFKKLIQGILNLKIKPYTQFIIYDLVLLEASNQVQYF